MADIISGTFNQLVEQASSNSVSTGGTGTYWIIGIGIFIGLAVLSIVIAFVWWWWSEKKKWNIITRVHYENPAINGISLGSPVLTKRVRFKDGRVVYVYKAPIQGYTISPELLTWSKPREHDVIVTQDKKLFCIIGLKNIDIQRKQLGVDIAYPDIEMDRQDLQKHIDSKKYDDPNERFKIIAKIALWIFVIIGVIVIITIGGKYYIDGKAIDVQRDTIAQKTAQANLDTVQQMNTFTLILSKVMPQSFKAIDGQNLLSQINLTNSTA